MLDNNGNVTRTTYPDGYYVQRTFDQLNRLTGVSLDGAAKPAFQFGYNALSQRTSLTYGNGVTVSYSPQLNGDMAALNLNFVSSSLAYTLAYNKVHQLTTSSVTDNTYVQYPATASTSYATATDVNEYHTVGSSLMTYNTDGSLTSDSVTKYTFDTEQHMVGATNSKLTATYYYDPFGRQVQKTVNGTTTEYIYSGWQRLADYNGTQLANRYVYGTGLDEVLVAVAATNNTPTYMHQDRLGSVIATTNASGIVTGKYTYGLFGETSNVPVGGFGFTGQRYDTELTLYHYKNRYYSPAQGRFLRNDPAGYAGGSNLYAYANNDPINNTDPLGLDQYDLLVPGGVPDPIGTFKNNLQQGLQHQGDYLWFFNQVKIGGPMDYKHLYNNYGPSHFGNVNYGALGTVLGIPDWQLYIGAGAAQAVQAALNAYNHKDYTWDPKWLITSYGDEPQDHEEVVHGTVLGKKYLQQLKGTAGSIIDPGDIGDPPPPPPPPWVPGPTDQPWNPDGLPTIWTSPDGVGPLPPMIIAAATVK